MACVGERAQHHVAVRQDRHPRDGAVVQGYPEPAFGWELEGSGMENIRNVVKEIVVV